MSITWGLTGSVLHTETQTIVMAQCMYRSALYLGTPAMTGSVLYAETLTIVMVQCRSALYLGTPAALRLALHYPGDLGWRVGVLRLPKILCNLINLARDCLKDGH